METRKTFANGVDDSARNYWRSVPYYIHFHIVYEQGIVEAKIDLESLDIFR